MIQVKFIDKEGTYHLQDLLKRDDLNHYDKDSIPFLKAYLGSSPTVEVSTSGSTGKPKKVELEKSKMKASANATVDYFKLSKGSSILLTLPVKFIAGKMIWVRAIERELLMVTGYPTSNPLKDLNQPIDFAAMTPQQVSIILDQNPEKFNHIKTLIIGGGAVSKVLHERLQQIPTRCFATYGMTETITHVAVQPLNGPQPKETYEGLNGITFSQNENQQLVIHAPHLSATPIITNDMVQLIDNKHFVWIGRIDFVVNSGGVKLFPEQIEKKLEKLITAPYFLWKENDDVLGEKLIMIVEGASVRIPKFDQVLDKIEIPKAIYHVPQFKYTENGKLDRLSTFNQLPDSPR